MRRRVTLATKKAAQLTEAVRRRPYRVILFDEIEKAHPDVFNILLQVLDDGRLTDGQGRTVDFRNTVIIMTSNIGSRIPRRAARQNEDPDKVRDKVMAELRRRFRPEFLNRIDEIILFHRLQRDQMGKIVDIQLARVKKLLNERKISLNLDDEGRKLLAEKGFDTAYGARPLKRVIQKLVQDPLAEKLLRGEIHDGEKLLLTCDGDELAFKKAS